MSWYWWVLIVFLIGFSLSIYCALILAGRADDQAEHIFQERKI